MMSLTAFICSGFGYALTWTPTVAILGLYFERRRPVANAMASAGECIFTFVLTPLFQLLIDSYSWRGGLLILGGLQLHLCVCGMLLRPLRAKEEGSAPKSDPDQGNTSWLEERELGISEQVQDLKEKTKSTREELDSNSRSRRAGLKAKILPYVDYTLITNGRFMVYSMFGVFAALGFFAPALFLVPYARSKGIDEYQAAALMSMSAAMDLFGRLFFGWVANLRLVQTVSSGGYILLPIPPALKT